MRLKAFTSAFARSGEITAGDNSRSSSRVCSNDEEKADTVYLPFFMPNTDKKVKNRGKNEQKVNKHPYIKTCKS